MNRRRYLHAVCTTPGVTLGGCVGFGGGNSLEVDHIADLAGHVAIQPSDLSAEQADALEAVREEDEYRSYGHRPFRDEGYVERDGSFYRAAVENTGSDERTRWVLGAEILDEEREDAVSLESYPESYHEPIVHAYRLARSRDERSDDDAGPSRFVYVFRVISADETALLPTPEHEIVVVAGETVRLWTEERDLEETEFTTSLTRVAESRAEAERYFEDRYVVDLDERDLTDEQVDILETAIDEGAYHERGGISEALDNLVAILRAETTSRYRLFAYGGEYYVWFYSHSD